MQPAQWATNIRIPIFVSHGTDDDLISIHRGKRLFEAFSSQKKRWIVVPDGTHQNILVTPMPLYQTMSQ
ncbi:MAG: alpha/beta hydrolase [Thiotrichaceae bacterium]